MLTLCLSLLLLVTNNSNNSSSQITDKKEEIMKFELIKLPYAANALEPVISKATIEFHHGKHLQVYSVPDGYGWQKIKTANFQLPKSQTAATPLHTDWFLSWDSMYGNMLITWITRTAVPII